MKKRGFTLIELLVVIAIIGILASIVLVSLGSARDKAKDVAIKSTLAGFRSSAELYADDAGYTYTGLCADSTYGWAQFTQGSGGDFQGQTGVCNDSASAWAACVQLIGTSADYYCVDSQGNSVQVTGETCSTFTDTVCP